MPPETAKTKLSRDQREAMIVEYAPLVKFIAGRMAMRVPASVQFDELVSAGCMGLIDAVDKYDPQKDANIKTYAAYRIKGAILDELRSMDWYSRTMRKKVQEIQAAILRIERRNEQPAQEREIAKEMGMELADFQKLLSRIYAADLLNLDEYIRNENNDPGQKRS
ncbi:sigma-70 family RNA polymerase sigma factor, partial [Desulfobacterales bacterium HSG17]|nr:sigma-70 family RNA polymerase sigma factor [Desulfobacterales bacterium HSG17]